MAKIMVPIGITPSAMALLLYLTHSVWGQGSEKIRVSIVGNNVTLTCPTETSRWWKEKGAREENLSCHSQTCTIGAGLNGRYGCSPNAPKIYLHVKECPEECVEMDLWVVVGIMAADLLLTLGVLALTYHCSRKRGAHWGGGSTAQPRGQKEARPPPVPNPDYEPIRRGQREVYAGLEPRAF